MWRQPAPYFLLFILTLSCAASSFSQPIAWVTSIDEARQIARSQGKPLLFDFSARWCGPCIRMDKIFWPKPEVAEHCKRFVCVKVDYDANKEFARGYGVTAIPNVILTDPWGRTMASQKGFGAVTESELLAKFVSVPTDFSSIIKAGNSIEANGNDVEALHKMLAFYQERGWYRYGIELQIKLVDLETDVLKRENILVNLAFNYLRVNDVNKAIEKFEDLKLFYPKSPQRDYHLYGLIYALSAKNSTKQAEAALSEMRQKHPRSPLLQNAEQCLASTASAGR